MTNTNGPQLTQRSLEVLDAVMKSPGISIRKLCREVGFSLNAAWIHLKKLRKLGLVTWELGRSRTLVATCRFISVSDLNQPTSFFWTRASPTLFSGTDAYGTPIVTAPATSPTIEQAKQARDDAIAKVEDEHAEFVRRAKEFVLKYLAEHGAKPGEEITDACIKAGIVHGDLRKIGAIYMGLARENKIVKVGTCTRKRGNGTTGGNVWGIAEQENA